MQKENHGIYILSYAIFYYSFFRFLILISYFATPAVNHLFALRVGLSILLANGGMEARFKEHFLMSAGIKEAISALGLSEVIIQFNFYI